MDVAAIVLAGGRNLRLGRNKALEAVDGKTLIECVIGRLKPLTSRIMVISSGEQLELPTACRAEILTDVYPGRGPLGGIYTGLLSSPHQYNVAVACDMPFLNTELLRYLVGLSSGFDAVVPRLGEHLLEPLHAIYAKSCLNAMKTRLERGLLGINPFLKTMRTRYVGRAECQRFDPQLLSFFNINREADLERAVEIAAGKTEMV